MINLFFDYGAVDVVRAEAQRDLGDFGRHHLPVGLDVREVVEHQAADGDLLDVEHAGGFRQMLEGRVIGMKRKRDEGLKAVRFVLQFPQLEEMIDAVLVVFDVAIEHGGV